MKKRTSTQREKQICTGRTDKLTCRRAAVAALTEVRDRIAIFERLVPWPALAESWRKTEADLIAFMTEKGWTT